MLVAAAESEKCVINSSVKAHTGDTPSVYVLCATIRNQCDKVSLYTSVGKNEQVWAGCLWLKAQLMVRPSPLMFPLQRVWMFSHLNNQCLFTSQSYFSHFFPQSKRARQTMSWMKYKHTAVLLMRPNTTLLWAIFRFHLNSSVWWIFLYNSDAGSGASVHKKILGKDELHRLVIRKDHLPNNQWCQHQSLVKPYSKAPPSNSTAVETAIKPTMRHNASDTKVLHCCTFQM